mmetsp:Transcript_24928/g.58491  ORF Transcript_24928/g.58491 Transcript_24928/m.58491 type:complete len:406 (+) Transcript_24928:19-1236(+)
MRRLNDVVIYGAIIFIARRWCTVGMHFTEIRLFLGSVHGQGVQESSCDGDGGSNDRSGAHGRLEGDDRGDDDDDSLDGVTDGVRDGVDLSEGQEGDFVVGVVRSATETEKHGQGLVREVAGGDGVLESGEETGALDGQHHGDQDGGGHGGQDGVKILGVEVLTDALSGHGLFRKDTTGRGGNIGKHGGGEREDGERKLLHRSDGDSSDDGKERHVHGQRKNLSQKEVVHQASYDGFGSLDDVGKRDSSCSKGDHSTDVNTGVAKSDGEKGLEIRETELRGLAKFEEPHWNEVEDTGSHLKCGNSPGVAEDIESLLVVDIVSNVEKVPKGEVGTDLEGFSQSGRSCFSGSLGSVSCELNSSPLGFRSNSSFLSGLSLSDESAGGKGAPLGEGTGRAGHGDGQGEGQ